MNRRGLTLVEVLMATVLLAMTAAACVPLLAAVPNKRSADEADVDHATLAEIADAIVADPASFGIDELASIGVRSVQWISPSIAEKNAHPIEVDLSVLREPDGVAEYFWLVVRVDDIFVLRSRMDEQRTWDDTH